MDLRNDTINLLKEIYKPDDSSFSFIMPILLFITTGVITMYYLIQIEINASRVNWDKNKCLPKYMFISGFIKKEQNLGVLGSIDKNFKRCVTNVTHDNNKLRDLYKK
jgi:hypothetical protein